MAKHTSEPTPAQSDGSILGPLVGHFGRIVAGNLSPAAHGITQEAEAWCAENVANARRIVACVNACAGIPTEALEHASKMGGDYSRLLILRDAVLAGVEAIEALCR
jgi:hypothetical protein